MVESDQEYVAAYAIAGNMVAYTVNYQDANGNALSDSETFYGAVGDQPVKPSIQSCISGEMSMKGSAPDVSLSSIFS